MKKILVIQTAFLGDLILSTPFFAQIKRFYPQAEVHVVVNQGTESLLYGNPAITKVWPFSKKIAKKNILYFLKFIKQIRSQNFEVVYAPHFSYRSSLISYFSGAPERIGYKESGFSFLHTKTIERPILGPHEVDKLFSLLGVQASDYPKGRERRPYLFFDSESESRVLQGMNRLGLAPKEFLAIAPSSLWETKRWPQARFQEFISLVLLETEYPIVLLGSKQDQELCNGIIQGLTIPKPTIEKRLFSLAGQTSLMELMVWIASAKILISNDSSPIHIASAFDTPTVMIYGATIPSFGYATLASHHRISEILGLDCRPCGIHGGNTCPKKHFQCMLSQSASQVFSHFKELLQEITP